MCPTSAETGAFGCLVTFGGERVPSTDERDVPARAKAVLIDPASMTVVWMNESAAEDAEKAGARLGMTVQQVVPVAEALGVPQALAEVAETGVARHLRADLVSTGRGSVAIVASIHRLPDGLLLLLMEHSWLPAHKRAGEDRPHRPRRRR